MARAVNTGGSPSYGTVNQTNNTQTLSWNFYISSTEGVDDWEDAYWAWGYSAWPTPTYRDTKDGTPPGTLWVNGISATNADCDDLVYVRVRGVFGADPSTTNYDQSKNNGPYRTYAADPTLGTPSLSGETSSSVTVDGTWIPATKDNTATLFIQYKKSVDPTWTQWGSSSDTGTAYATLNIDQTVITGLDAETSYDFRFYVTRVGTSNPVTTYNGTSAATSTIADTPSVTTDDATSVSWNTATFKATVDHNTVDGNLSWRYDTSDPGDPDDTSGTEIDSDDNPITGDGTYTKGVTGLSESQTYYYWAIYDPTGAGDTIFGTVKSLTTLADPGTTAKRTNPNVITQYVDGQYGVATTVYFTLRQPAATDNDLLYTGSAPVQADVKIMKDGTYDNTSDNAPAQVDSGNMAQMYSLQLSATEMQADVVDVIISDAAGSAFRDHHIQVRTQQNLGTIVVNAAQKGTNTDAVTLTGNGTGAGLNCVAGDSDGVGIRGVLGDHVQNYGTVAAYDSTTQIDLDNSTAVDTTDYYNGSIILFHTGAGSGQARIITDYVAGGEYRCTLHKALTAPVNTATEYIIIPGADTWFVAPGAELSAMPTFSSTMMQIVQFLFQRFAYQREQTATAFTMRKVDDAASFASGGVDDDNTTQTHNRLT
jgi:hypothetical protein